MVHLKSACNIHHAFTQKYLAPNSSVCNLLMGSLLFRYNCYPDLLTSWVLFPFAGTRISVWLRIVCIAVFQCSPHQFVTMAVDSVGHVPTLAQPTKG